MKLSSATEKFKYNQLFYLIYNKTGGVKMGRVVVKNVVKRKPGHLYYVDGSGNVCEAKMARGGRRKKPAKKKAVKKVIKKKKK